MEKCCAGPSQRMLVWPSLVANPEKLPAIHPAPGIPAGKSTFPSPIQVKFSPPRLDFPLKWLCEEVAHRAGWDPGRPAGLVYKKQTHTWAHECQCFQTLKDEVKAEPLAFGRDERSIQLRRKLGLGLTRLTVWWKGLPMYPNKHIYPTIVVIVNLKL